MDKNGPFLKNLGQVFSKSNRNSSLEKYPTPQTRAAE
jgi:hypothetical protein